MRFLASGWQEGEDMSNPAPGSLTPEFAMNKTTPCGQKEQVPSGFARRRLRFSSWPQNGVGWDGSAAVGWSAGPFVRSFGGRRVRNERSRKDTNGRIPAYWPLLPDLS